MTETEARRALIDAGRHLQNEGLVARSWGNISVRLDQQRMLVTPSGILWPDVTESMLAVVDLETGDWSGHWKPSGERKVHREIYRRRADVNAVVHTHQNAASACAAARVAVPLGTELIPCAPYALPGTKALTRGTVGALGAGPAVLMANHGVFTVGTDLAEAFERVRSLEKACADLIASKNPDLPARADQPWKASWLLPLHGHSPEAPLYRSAAPFTREWSSRGLPLKALLDDLAQLAGSRVEVLRKLPEDVPEGAVLIKDGGAVVSGPDAEALAMVVEKAARAALGAEGLGGAHAFPAWEAWLMRLVYKNSYSKLAGKK